MLSLGVTLQEHVLAQPRPYYRWDSGAAPDRWLAAVQVWEVKCGDLSISPVYRAAVGLVSGAGGHGGGRRAPCVRPRWHLSPVGCPQGGRGEGHLAALPPVPSREGGQEARGGHQQHPGAGEGMGREPGVSPWCVCVCGRWGGTQESGVSPPPLPVLQVAELYKKQQQIQNQQQAEKGEDEEFY